MASKVLSIEVGANFTRLCLTDYKVKSPKVHKYAKVATPENVVMDGEVQATPEYISLIKQTIAENGMKAKQVIFPITSSKVATREVTIPYVKEKQIDTLIRANIKDYFPIDLSQHELGYLQLAENQANNERKILLLAVPRLILDSYKKLASALGMQMIALDYSGNSIFQMVKNDCKDGVKMVVKVDETGSIITIVENSAIVLQRNIAYGIDDAINTIVNNPAFEANSYEDALDVAFRKTCMKLSINAKELRETDDEEATDDAKLLAAKQEVSSSLNMLLNGVARIMDYYGSRNGGKTVDNIYITGLGADFSGLSKLFTNELGIKTVGLKHLEGHSIEKSFKDGRFGEYIACVGAAIDPVGFVSEGNTSGSAKAEKSASKSDYTALAWILFIGGIVIGGALLATSYMGLMSEKSDYNANVRKLTELKPFETIYNNYLVATNANADVHSMYGLTDNRNTDFVDFIEEMEQKFPSQTHITTLTSTTEGVSMNVQVSTKEEMANLVQILRSFDSITSVTVGGVSDTWAEDVRIVEFAVSATYKTNAEIAAEAAANGEN